MKKLLASTVALGVVLAGLVGVQPANSATTLDYGVVTDIKDWQASSAQVGNWAPYYQAVYSNLIGQKATGTLVPALAKSWKYSSNNTVLTLTLREGVKFSNGEAFNAAAVVKNLNANKLGASPEASFLSLVSKVEAKGANTVVITLTDADQTFLASLSKGPGFMQAPSTVGTPEAKSNPIGTGPYIYDSAASVSGSSYAFKSNPNYWDKANRVFSTINIKVLPTAAAAVNALKAGQVDCINIQDTTAVAGLKAAGFKMAVQQYNWRGLTFVDRGGRMGTALKNVKVRQAINYAIDRDAALKVIGGGYGVVTDQVFASYHKGYVAALENTYSYDIAKAKALLTEAGYEKGFSIDMPQNAALPPTAYAFIKDQLSKVGITVNLVNVNGTDFYPQFAAAKHAMVYAGLGRDNPDWAMIKFFISRDAQYNPMGYGDKTSDALIAKIQKSTGNTQAKYLKELNTYITKQAWFAPFYAQDTYFGYNSKVKVTVHGGATIPYLSDISIN